MLSNYPRVWARGPGYRESALVYDIRDKKRTASVRANLRAAKVRRRKASMPETTKTASAGDRINGILSAISAPVNNFKTKHALVAKLSLLRERALRAIRYTARRRGGRASHILPGATVGRTILRIPTAPSRVKKQKAL